MIGAVIRDQASKGVCSQGLCRNDNSKAGSLCNPPALIVALWPQSRELLRFVDAGTVSAASRRTRTRTPTLAADYKLPMG